MPAIQTDERLIAQLFDAQPDSVVWFVPVFKKSEEKEVIDFEVRYCNNAACGMLNAAREEILGARIRHTTLMDKLSRNRIFRQCSEVWTSGQSTEYTHHSPKSDKYFIVLRSVVAGGVLSITRDCTVHLHAERERGQLARANACELEAIFNSSASGLYAAEAVNGPDGAVVDLIFLRANSSFLKMLGRTAEQVIGKSLLSLSGGDSQGTFLSCIQEALHTQVPVHKIVYYPNWDRWYEYSIVRLDGKKISVTVNDSTQQKQKALEKERQKNLLDNILKRSASGISVSEAVRDEQGRVVDWRTILANEAAISFIGLPEKDVLTKTFGEIAPELLESPTAIDARKTLTTGEPFMSQLYLEPSGKWLEIAVSKMDEDHLINIITDITSTKGIQLQLERSVEELKRTNANLEEFTYAASHDLKEPIRKVHFFADRLKQRLASRMDGEELHMFERMEIATERMKQLVDDLLDYSHASLKPHELEDIDLNERLHHVLTDLELLIRERQAEITAGPLPIVRGHRRQLQQLFQNLVGNALKYARPGVVSRISVTSRTVTGSETGLPLPAEEQGKQFYLIEVADNGIGFEQKDAERIFNVFTRLHGNKEYTGTGVGLSIARKVVENHNGYISAIGVPDKGATFQVFLPVGVGRL